MKYGRDKVADGGEISVGRVAESTLLRPGVAITGAIFDSVIVCYRTGVGDFLTF